MIERQMTAVELAEEYRRLGGTRKVVTDDNKISTRIWEKEPAEAARFWEEKVVPRGRKGREEVETLLPSI